MNCSKIERMIEKIVESSQVDEFFDCARMVESGLLWSAWKVMLPSALI